MSFYDNAVKLKNSINVAAANLTDEVAVTIPDIYPVWAIDTNYEANVRVNYEGILYRCLTSHTSQPDWTPSAAPSLWVRVLIPDSNVIPEWIQPDSTNPYSKGDKVTHNGKTWISDVDSNVWEPGVYGWTEGDA